MPRPSFHPMEDDRKLVKTLSAMGLPHEEICVMVGLRSPKTLRKHFREELSTGMAEANTVVARVAYEMARSGRFPAMTFFWLKCQTKRVENVDDEKPVKDWTVEVRFPGKEDVPGYETRVTHGAA